jgi:tRNA(Arg) A34 adenosine deaminase TadA
MTCGGAARSHWLHRPAGDSLRRAWRRRGLAGAPRAAVALARKMPPHPEDEGFMRLALEEAAKGDFPFGAVIVRAGEVVARGRNLGKTNNDPTAHGEMVAIRNFLLKHPAAAFAGTTLYTSGEPCPMCMSAIIWCGIGRVVFAASIEKLATKIGQMRARGSRTRRQRSTAPRSRLRIEDADDPGGAGRNHFE